MLAGWFDGLIVRCSIRMIIIESNAVLIESNTASGRVKFVLVELNTVLVEWNTYFWSSEIQIFGRFKYCFFCFQVKYCFDPNKINTDFWLDQILICGRVTYCFSRIKDWVKYELFADSNTCFFRVEYCFGLNKYWFLVKSNTVLVGPITGFWQSQILF